ncbi:MAG: hypothetical protein WHU54_02325 [Candidatus Bathyarchaeia archaeon]
MDFGNHALLKKYLDTFDKNHPLLVHFYDCPASMDYVENLFAELGGIPNFKNKIDRLRKDGNNWESYLSELVFAEKLKKLNLNPKFLIERKGFSTPDIKVNIVGEDVFFEVETLLKLLKSDAIRRVWKEIGKIESDFIVKIDFGTLDYEWIDKEADNLIKFIKSKISAKETGSYSYPVDKEAIDTLKRDVGTHHIKIEITENASAKTKRTEDATLSSFKILMEPVRKKVFENFFSDKKQKQFKSYSPIFWVIDCQILDVSIECFASIVNELFSQEEAKCLNGVIVRIYGCKYEFWINHLAKKQLCNEQIEKLNELFQKSVPQRLPD